MDGAHCMVINLWAYHLGVLLSWTLSALGREVVVCGGTFKSITPGHLSEYASLCGISSLETGVVLRPHMSGLHQDRMFSLFMIACLHMVFMLLSNLSLWSEVTVLLLDCHCLAQ